MANGLNSFYTGRGGQDTSIRDRLPTVNPEALRDPKHYRASPELATAVDVALTLGMPLLLTGEPGSGKSGLADSLAWEIGLGKVLKFPVKSDTESRDLFYRFDTVGRFHAAQTKPGDDTALDPKKFITFAALGKAILLAKDRAKLIALGLQDHVAADAQGQCRSVVLIDEIDKAPRDVPNDMLVEIEHMQFNIPELADDSRSMVQVNLIGDENRYRPIVIFTSNSEKALPDPFLRRCVYHHLGFPPFKADAQNENVVTVESIVQARLGDRYSPDGRIASHVASALRFVRYLREERHRLERLPTLAEILDWLNYLMPQRTQTSEWTILAALDAGATDSASQKKLADSIKHLLLKTAPDQIKAGDLLKQWREQPRAESKAG